jgi:tryptophanyl-tRNA synthetase
MAKLRSAVGLRPLTTGAQVQQEKSSKVATASFKQYREKDGKFYFKLVDAGGAVLLQSLAFDSPKVAGQTIAALQMQGTKALPDALGLLQPVRPEQLAAVHSALDALTTQ